MKRQGIARLIPWLIALNVLLLTAFLFVRILDIHIDAPVDAPDVLPEWEEQLISVVTPPPFELGDEPEQLLIDSSEVDRPVETELPMGDETRQTTLVAGSFALRGGPVFSLYLDQDVFQRIENEGRCYFCPVQGASDLYLEIAYFYGVSADALAASVFQDYGIIIQKNEVENADLNGQAAKHVSAKTMENQLEAYVLDAEGGCVTLVFCTPGAAASKTQNALEASMQTFEIAQRP